MNTFTTDIGTSLQHAARWLEAGEPVAIPTETVYGLAANALAPKAVVKIFEVKNRPHFDPLIVHVGHVEALDAYATNIPEAAHVLARHFWPGPLSLLLPKNNRIPDLVTSGLPRVALRMPAHETALSLLRSLDFPLAAPSANPFGYISPTTARHVWDQLQGRIPYILDGGPCHIGVESTIVGFENGRCVVHRLGGVTVEALEAVIGPVLLEVSQNSNPAAPGMLDTHYAPRKPLYLGDLQQLQAHFTDQKTGIIRLRPESGVASNPYDIALSGIGDVSEAAQHLFAAMRRLDAADIDLILAEWMPEKGLGRAMNDRLRRAAVARHLWRRDSAF